MSFLILEVHGKRYAGSNQDSVRYWVIESNATTKIIEEVPQCETLADVPGVIKKYLTQDYLPSLKSLMIRKKDPGYALLDCLKSIWDHKRQGTHCKFAKLYLADTQDKQYIRQLEDEARQLRKQLREAHYKLDQTKAAICGDSDEN